MSQEVSIDTSDGRYQLCVDSAFCDSSGVAVENYETVQLFIASWLHLLSDSPLNSSKSGYKPNRVFKTFVNLILADGLKTVVLRYSALAHKLASLTHIYGTSSFNDEFIEEFKKTPVFKEYLQYYRTDDPRLFKFLYTFLTFGKKMPYKDENFHSTAFRNWLDLEQRLSSWTYDFTDLATLKRIMRVLLPPLSLDGFYPKFGPGSVSERGVRGRIEKVSSFAYDLVIDQHIFGGHLGHYGSAEHLGLSPSKVVPNLLNWEQKRKANTRASRLMFVAKDLKTSRSICMEPNVLQFFQQGVWDRARVTLEKSPFHQWIHFRDQAYNRSLAEIGSYTGEIDTLDLSSASDSVSFALIKEIFPSSWQIAMRATRSSQCILPDGRIHDMTKFAPMGSALCFPTQSIIFASVCIYAALIYQHQVSGRGTFEAWIDDLKIIIAAKQFSGIDDPFGKQFRPLGIFGDDICVDTRLTDIIVNILLRLGFLVNLEKSFTGSQAFRESCGGFYLNGIEVNPMYYRIKFNGRLTGDSLSSMVALANASFDNRYMNLRRFLIRCICYTKTAGYHRKRGRSIPSTTKNPVLFVPLNSDIFGIRSEYPFNPHLRTRWNPDYQVDEVQHYGISYDFKNRDTNLSLDPYEYMRWMSSRRYGKLLPVEGNHNVETGGARIVRRWTPTIA